MSDDPDGFVTGLPSWNFPNGNVSGTMSIATPTGSGTVRPILVPRFSQGQVASNVVDAEGNPWPGGEPAGPGNGFSVDRDGPAATLRRDPIQFGSTAETPVRFLLDFTNEDDVDYGSIEVGVSGTAGATTAQLVPDSTSGSDPLDRVIQVTGMTGPGTVIVAIADGGFTDTLANPSDPVVLEASDANVTQYTGGGTTPPPGPTPTPTPSPGPAPAPAPTPAPLPTPGPNPPPAPPANTSPPKLVLGSFKSLRLTTKGLRVPVRCTDPGGTCTVTISVTSKKQQLCGGTAGVEAQERALTVRCTKAGRRAIARAGRKGLPITVTVVAKNALGYTAKQGKTGSAKQSR